MNHGIKTLGVLVLFALLGCSVANGDNTNTAAFVKAVIAGQDLYVMGKDNQLVITPLKNDRPIRILSPVQPGGSFFLPPCWDITNNSLYLTYASDSLTGQFSVKLLEIPIASMRPYDGQDEHRLRIPHIEHRVVQAFILEDAYIRSQFGKEYESAVADMHVASNSIVTIVVQQNKKLYLSTFDLKDRKKNWTIESAPTDRTLSPFVAIRGDGGVSVISQNGQTHRVSGKEVSMVKKKSNAGSQSGQVNVEADVQIMVVDKRKPDISCLRFGMKDKSIQFHGNGIERTAADTAAINKISDALERAMSALLKTDTAQNRKTVRETSIIAKEPIPDDNMTKWGPKLSAEELAAIAKLSTSELVDMLNTGDTLHRFAALKQLEADGGRKENFDLLLDIAAECCGDMIVDGMVRPIPISASAEDKRMVDSFLDFLEGQLTKDKPSVSGPQAVRSIAQTVYFTATIRPIRRPDTRDTVDSNDPEIPYANERVVDILVRCLDNKDKRIRTEAIHWLGRVGANDLDRADQIVTVLKAQLARIETGKESERIKASMIKASQDSLRRLERDMDGMRIGIWTPNGWWILIETDGSGLYGFGSSGGDSCHFAPGTFNSCEIEKELASKTVKYGNISEYYSISFEKKTSKSTVAVYTKDEVLVRRIFKLAYENRGIPYLDGNGFIRKSDVNDPVPDINLLED